MKHANTLVIPFLVLPAVFWNKKQVSMQQFSRACVLCKRTDPEAWSGPCTGPSEYGRSSHGLWLKSTARANVRSLMPRGRRPSGWLFSSLSPRASSAAPPSCRRCPLARDLSSGARPGPLSGCRRKEKLYLSKKQEDGSGKICSGSEKQKKKKKELMKA